MVDTSTEAVERLLDGVTPGPWRMDTVITSCGVCHKIGPWPHKWRHGIEMSACIYDDYPPSLEGTDNMQANASFIAAARDLVPALLAERDALAAAKWSAEADVARRLEMHECAMAERDDCIEDWSKANDRIKALEGALGWYAEQTSLCRLIHSEGDVGRNALANDGGDRSRAAIAASRAASDCQQRDLVIAEAAPIREITDADMANIVDHLSYECEPKGPLPNANSLMMEVVRLRNAIADGRE